MSTVMKYRVPCEIVNFLTSTAPILSSRRNLVGIKHSPFLRPTYFTTFALTPHCQYPPIFNLRPLVLGLTPSDWPRPIMLMSTHYIIFYRNVIFDLRLYFTTTLFGKTTRAQKGSGLRLVREIISDKANYLSLRILLHNISILKLGPREVQHRLFVLLLCN